MFAFGQLESREMAIALGFEGKGAGNGNGGQNGDGGDDRGDGSMDGTTSGGGVHSTRVKTVLLTTESQHTRQNRRNRNGNSPVSSMPPTNHANRPYGLVMHHRRHGRLKIKSIKVSQLETVETTYQECARVVQPPVYHAERLYGLVRRRH